MTKKILKDAKVGDRVKSILNGWGTRGEETDSGYIFVKFDRGYSHYYTQDGKRSELDLYPEIVEVALARWEPGPLPVELYDVHRKLCRNIAAILTYAHQKGQRKFDGSEGRWEIYYSAFAERWKIRFIKPPLPTTPLLRVDIAKALVDDLDSGRVELEEI